MRYTFPVCWLNLSSLGTSLLRPFRSITGARTVPCGFRCHQQTDHLIHRINTPTAMNQYNSWSCWTVVTGWQTWHRLDQIYNYRGKRNKTNRNSKEDEVRWCDNEKTPHSCNWYMYYLSKHQFYLASSGYPSYSHLISQWDTYLLTLNFDLWPWSMNRT